MQYKSVTLRFLRVNSTDDDSSNEAGQIKEIPLPKTFGRGMTNTNPPSGFATADGDKKTLR